MSTPKTLTEAEIRALQIGPVRWQTDGPEPDDEDGAIWAVLDDELDTVCEGIAGPRMARLIAAAPDLAHTALEAMRRERILMRALLDPDLCAYCCHEDCAATFRAVDPTSGLRYCDAHAPAGSVRVVP